VKALTWALPWIIVAVAALIFAYVYPPHDPNAEKPDPLYWYELKKAAIAMLLGGLIVRFGGGVAEGIEEGLKARQGQKPK
jgi:hypothetical protein